MPQIVSPSVPSDPTTITERYDALVANGTIERDPAQEEVVAVLDALAHRLKDIKQTRFGLTRPLDQGDSFDEKGRGIYIFGGVGRGKTMLMDLFFRERPAGSQAPDTFSRVHGGCARPALESSREDGRSPYERWRSALTCGSSALATEARLLCFDELAVTDIADAFEPSVPFWGTTL